MRSQKGVLVLQVVDQSEPAPASVVMRRVRKGVNDSECNMAFLAQGPVEGH